MTIEFTVHGWEEFSYWTENDPAMVEKINEIIGSVMKTPFSGIGKPEPLKYDLKGFWSRRISGEHRLIYKISGTKGTDQKCFIIQCSFHY